MINKIKTKKSKKNNQVIKWPQKFEQVKKMNPEKFGSSKRDHSLKQVKIVFSLSSLFKIKQA